MARYRAFADAIRALAAKERFEVPCAGAGFIFRVPMPSSWSKKKRATMYGQPHQQTPDIDNFLKATLDALCEQDCVVWHIAGAQKVWSDKGSITIILEAAA